VHATRATRPNRVGATCSVAVKCQSTGVWQRYRDAARKTHARKPNHVSLIKAENTKKLQILKNDYHNISSSSIAKIPLRRLSPKLSRYILGEARECLKLITRESRMDHETRMSLRNFGSTNHRDMSR